VHSPPTGKKNVRRAARIEGHDPITPEEKKPRARRILQFILRIGDARYADESECRRRPGHQSSKLGEHSGCSVNERDGLGETILSPITYSCSGGGFLWLAMVGLHRVATRSRATTKHPDLKDQGNRS